MAALVREIMADKAQWRGSASDLLQVGTNRSGWPKTPRALAGRLRRTQAFLRTLGIEIAFGREGRLGTRRIRITAMGENRRDSTVSVKPSSAWTGTEPLIVQTLLTVLTQKSRTRQALKMLASAQLDHPLDPVRPKSPCFGLGCRIAGLPIAALLVWEAGYSICRSSLRACRTSSRMCQRSAIASRV